ncbi:hypothetical protein GCM10009790_19300 [Georgenia ruanii]
MRTRRITPTEHRGATVLHPESGDVTVGGVNVVSLALADHVRTTERAGLGHGVLVVTTRPGAGRHPVVQDWIGAGVATRALATGRSAVRRAGAGLPSQPRARRGLATMRGTSSARFGRGWQR